MVATCVSLRLVVIRVTACGSPGRHAFFEVVRVLPTRSANSRVVGLGGWRTRRETHVAAVQTLVTRVVTCFVVLCVTAQSTLCSRA